MKPKEKAINHILDSRPFIKLILGFNNKKELYEIDNVDEAIDIALEEQKKTFRIASKSMGQTSGAITKGLLKELRKQIYKWSEEWFDNKRKNNDIWRMNQDELTSMFLEELKKRWYPK